MNRGERGGILILSKYPMTFLNDENPRSESHLEPHCLVYTTSIHQVPLSETDPRRI